MLKLTAPLKDYIWGGTNLKEKYGKISEGNIAEAWELSTHPDGLCMVSDGCFAGKSLLEVLKMHPEFYQLKTDSFVALPVLFKLIDSVAPLSVQVHPDDAYAQKTENSLGKTECWYILEASEDASIYLGLNRDTTREEFEEKIKSGTVESLLKRVPVHPGEIYYIPSGIVHAIGKGVTLAELQQSSNITYRVFDYNRLGKDGKPRQLHIAKALDVIRFEKGFPAVPSDNMDIASPDMHIRNILKTGLFYLDRMELSGSGRLEETPYFKVLTCIGGKAELSSCSGAVSIEKGETVFICAGENVTVTGKASLLLYGIIR